MRKQNPQSGVAWIEVLVLAAILLLLASLLLRLRYRQVWLAAEYSFVQSLGISREVYDIFKIGILGAALLCYIVNRLRRARGRP
jgi:hypothetical protein